MSYDGRLPYTRHSWRWEFNGKFEEAVADAMARVADARAGGDNYPSELSVKWDGSGRSIFICEIAFDHAPPTPTKAKTP